MSVRLIPSIYPLIQTIVLAVIITRICVCYSVTQEECTNKYDCNRNICQASSNVACRNNKCECWKQTRYEENNNIEYIYPEGDCETVQICKDWGNGGQLTCKNGLCACTDNSTYVRNWKLHIMGCYKHAGINETCRSDIDCQGIGTKCLESKEPGAEMTCQCGPQEEYNESMKRCNHIKNFASFCENDVDCKQDDLYCNREEHISFGRCLCKDDYVVVKHQCILYKDTNLCQTDSHCKPGYACFSDETIFKKCKVKTVRYGGDCSINEQCETHYNHMICDDKKKCSCGEATVWSEDYQNCLSSKVNEHNSFGQHGSHCDSSDDCKIKGSICTNDQNSYRTCQCPVNSVIYNTECVSIDSALYSFYSKDPDMNKCTEDFPCKRGYTCFCGENKTNCKFGFCKIEKVKYGEDCSVSEQCKTKKDVALICNEENKCSCDQGFEWCAAYEHCCEMKHSSQNLTDQQDGQHNSSYIHGLSRKKRSACSNEQCGSSERSAVDNVTTSVYTTDSVNNNKEVSASIQTIILSCVIGGLAVGILVLAVLRYRNKRSFKKQSSGESAELMEKQPGTVS